MQYRETANQQIEALQNKVNTSKIKASALIEVSKIKASTKVEEVFFI